ncbi:HepT-like ribonuclease domain-containing protein [Halotia wernerae UHCC 0503]|nr:HepT-like ribonuclease domain-containing protein [Halotia wernerae UHCC 0503]
MKKARIRRSFTKKRYYTLDNREAFLQTTIIQDAVIRNFEIIGEATKRLSPEIKAAYQDDSESARI